MNTPHGSSGHKPLRRSKRERMIAGVCGGFGEYFSIDANLIRLVIVVLTLFGGAGAFVYVVGWLLLPEESEDTSIAERLLEKVQRR